MLAPVLTVRKSAQVEKLKLYGKRGARSIQDQEVYREICERTLKSDISMPSRSFFYDISSVSRLISLRGRRIFHNGDKREVPVPSGGIKAVTDDEFVWDHEAGIVDDQLLLNTRFGFIEECGDLN